MKARLSLSDFIEYTRHQKIVLSAVDRKRVLANRSVVEEILRSGDAERVYGLNTGVGPLLDEDVALDPETQARFQENLLISHAAGTGKLLSAEEVRGMMLLLINMLRKGHSAISPETLGKLVEFYNRNILPAVPEQGSVGASGDLAPQAHLALPLLGKGDVLHGDIAIPTHFSFEFEQGRVRPITLKAGEALALINGTHFMTSILSLTVWRALNLLFCADIAAAMTIMAFGGSDEPFCEELQKWRPHPGQRRSAKNLRVLLSGAAPPFNLQDAYSLRCTAHVHGTAGEAVFYAKRVVEREMNSLTGNPLFLGSRPLHGGNFHGQVLSQAADFLSIALTTMANISERRLERLLNPALNQGLTPFLRDESVPGDSGLMIVQYAAAALASENKTLSHPASVDSIPTGGGQEDFVSMGAWSVRKAKQVCENTKIVLAIELLAASRAIKPRSDLREEALYKIAEVVNGAVSGLSLHAAIERVSQLVRDGVILNEAEKLVGKLQ